MSELAPVDPSGSWPVPAARGPVAGLLRLPGSKSITNRALVLAALSRGPSAITGPLVARDTMLMVGALRALGCRIDDPVLPDSPITDAAGTVPTWHTHPGRPAGPAAAVDVGNAGTVLRFVPPIAALTDAEVTFTGDTRISQRPVGELLAALRRLGAVIDDDGTGAVPFVVHGTGKLPGGAVTIDASASSQLVSGLLLAGSRFEQGVEVRHEGAPVPSLPHIEMTIRMLAACGADVSADPVTAGAPGSVTRRWRVRPGSLSLGEVRIEPDLSNALPFLAAAIVTGGEVTIADWPIAGLQPADQILELLTRMGATVRQAPGGLAVAGEGRIQGIQADLSAVGELTPVLTALAALASSPSEFTGIGHLRRHESDRLAALATEIGKLGGDVTESSDGLRVTPRPLRGRGVVFDSHDDHRLVMAAAVLGLVLPGLRVADAETAGKTFPGFAEFWTRNLRLAT